MRHSVSPAPLSVMGHWDMLTNLHSLDVRLVDLYASSHGTMRAACEKNAISSNLVLLDLIYGDAP